MFDEMYNVFGDDPRFEEFVNGMMENIVLQMSNEIKFNKRDVEDSCVKTTLSCLFKDYSFTFLRSINLVQNGADAEKMGNINEFIDSLEKMYFEGRQELDDFKKEQETYGGL